MIGICKKCHCTHSMPLRKSDFGLCFRNRKHRVSELTRHNIPGECGIRRGFGGVNISIITGLMRSARTQVVPPRGHPEKCQFYSTICILNSSISGFLEFRARQTCQPSSAHHQNTRRASIASNTNHGDRLQQLCNK